MLRRRMIVVFLIWLTIIVDAHQHIEFLNDFVQQEKNNRKLEQVKSYNLHLLSTMKRDQQLVNLTLTNFVFMGRHGPREEDDPVYYIYNTEAFVQLNGNISAEKYIVGYYTPQGQNISLNTGRWLRQRYVGENNLLQDDRFSKLYKTLLLHSNVHRTSEMAQLIKEGLYPPGTGDFIDNETFALPFGRSSLAQLAEEALLPFDNCPKVAGRLKKFFQSILTDFPPFMETEYINALQQQNPSAFDFYQNIWLNRIAPFLQEGVRLSGPGAIVIIARSIQSNPGTEAFSLFGTLVQPQELTPAKFFGMFSVAISFFIPYIDSSLAADPGAHPYLDWLVENLIAGRDSRKDITSATQGNAVAIIVAHHGQAGLAFYPMNETTFVEWEVGDGALWERFTDSLGNHYIKTFFVKASNNLEDIQAIQVYIDDCNDPFLCTEAEFLQNIQYFLNKDTASECLDEPRCSAQVIVLSNWTTGAVLEVIITPGVHTFGWEVQLDFTIDNFQVVNVWNTVLVSQESNALYMKHQLNHNYNGIAGIPLAPIGMQINFNQPGTIKQIWLNGYECLSSV